MLARYAAEFPSVPYVAKLNGKTNLGVAKSWWHSILEHGQDPYSSSLWTVEQALTIAHHAQISLCGIGFTVYIGSQFEDRMLSQAAQAIYHAHQHGLVAMLWVYPRGKMVSDPSNAHVVAGAAGVAQCLGADFVKIHPPQAQQDQSSEILLQEAVHAAGNTGVICAGGSFTHAPELLARIEAQLMVAHTRGCAIGRSLFQLPLDQAKELGKKINELVYS